MIEHTLFYSSQQLQTLFSHSSFYIYIYIDPTKFWIKWMKPTQTVPVHGHISKAWEATKMPPLIPTTAGRCVARVAARATVGPDGQDTDVGTPVGAPCSGA